MPTISLKPNSPEYKDEQTNTYVRKCDMPGCSDEADHKAPKHRGLNEYHHFCFEHVREYNKAWNFFEGMSDSEVHEHTVNSIYGDRPTWKYGVNGDFEDHLYRQAWQTYNNTEEEPKRQNSHAMGAEYYQGPEREALAIMGLEPPVTLEDIRSRYKDLVKKHHPDLNGGCKKSEELLKSINMAYTILKVAYEEFEKLPERS